MQHRAVRDPIRNVISQSPPETTNGRRPGDSGAAPKDAELARLAAALAARRARAITEARLNKNSESDADQQAAKRIASDVAEHYEKFGITP
jgi:hypothetical protein